MKHRTLTLATLLLLATAAFVCPRFATSAAGEKAESLDPRDVHAANAGAFLAGTVQGQAALPARIARSHNVRESLLEDSRTGMGNARSFEGDL